MHKNSYLTGFGKVILFLGIIAVVLFGFCAHKLGAFNTVYSVCRHDLLGQKYVEVGHGDWVPIAPGVTLERYCFRDKDGRVHQGIFIEKTKDRGVFTCDTEHPGVLEPLTVTYVVNLKTDQMLY